MVTAELAVGLIALSIVVQFLLVGGSLAAAQLQVVDAARISVRLAARGEAPDVITHAVQQVAPNAHVTLASRDGVMTAVVTEPPPGPLARRLMREVSASARSVDESVAPGG